MRRRDFLGVVGGAVPAWPLAARAQQGATTPVIGFLAGNSSDGFSEQLRGFRQGLKEVGYVEGENVLIEYRWAENQLDRLPALAADLVSKRVAVIAAHGGTVPAIAAKAATSSIPIVFTIPENPVPFGLVASLSRPGGNATGVNILIGELMSKRIELLHEMVPRMARVAFLVNSANAARAELQVKEAESAISAMGLKAQVYKVATQHEINPVWGD